MSAYVVLGVTVDAEDGAVLRQEQCSCAQAASFPLRKESYQSSGEINESDNFRLCSLSHANIYMLIVLRMNTEPLENASEKVTFELISE